MKSSSLQISKEIILKYGEYFEMLSVDEGKDLLVDILCDMLIKERNMNQYLTRRLESADRYRSSN